VKLLDFGIAKIVAGEPRDSEGELRAYGTAEYMSPEQITGGTIDPRTDLYGVGAVLYEALSGTAAFAQKPGVKSTVFMRILREVPPRVVGLREPVPDDLASFIDQLLAKSPDMRPLNAQDALQTVDEMGIVHLTSLSSIRVAPKR
jgi:serine/threonine-protein kinase